jgi:uncharacterized protein YdeI (YjbR/CyaY-like superfamily)
MQPGEDGLPVLPFASPAEFAGWLSEHHDSAAGLWIKFAKKASGVDTVVYAEALELALCHGWIDGQVAKVDESFYAQRFTPRRARSKWSKINRDNVERLIAEGRMQPAGLAEIERAKADGRWDAAYDAPSAATVPDDLQRALDAEPGAAAFFATLNSRNRFAILYRIQDAKRPETRARRIETLVAMLAEGKKLYP